MTKDKFKLSGNAHVFGNDINTDEIIAAKHLHMTDAKELGKYCLIDKKKDFHKKLKEGDIIVGGKNFGCGSSREHAPMAIKGCGVSCVIAISFARIFFRNSINMGLPILECAEAGKIKDGDKLEVDLKKGIIKNLTKKEEYKTEAFPTFISTIMNAGGLIKSLLKSRSSLRKG
jgi:3-isopropylmalate/(R)-2-methylmalate dehydratase small subunit